MSELPDLSELRCGATGEPAYRDPGEELAGLRRQQRQCGWDDATPLLRDASQAYREVYGTREQRREPESRGGSTFL